jgi:ABC-type Fe3+ transport system substrate-binding protein
MSQRLLAVAAFSLIVLVCGCFVGASVSFAAAADPARGKAKQDAEAAGYAFFTSHDEIVAGAKKEARLRLLGSLAADTYKALVAAFKKHYPFIVLHTEEIKSTDAHQPFILELKAGRATEWDVLDMAPDFYAEYLPFVRKFDLVGMATQKVLNIPLPMIDPKNRSVVSTASVIQAIAYNRKLLSEEKVPNGWDDFLKPEFKGKKFLVDIRPQGFAALAAGLGEKWALEYGAKIAAQEPVWVRGQSRSFAGMAIGENALFLLANYHSCMRAAKKDASGSLQCKVIEPVPVRLDEFAAVSTVSSHPYSGLLWLEFLSGPEGQSIIDKYETFNTSIYSAETALARAAKGKKLSVNNWDTLQNTSRWEEMVFKAFGFPKAEK